MELNRKDSDVSLDGMVNPFKVAHDDCVPNQGGPQLLAIHKNAREEKAQINSPANNPLGNDPSYVVKAKLRK